MRDYSIHIAAAAMLFGSQIAEADMEKALIMAGALVVATLIWRMPEIIRALKETKKT